MMRKIKLVLAIVGLVFAVGCEDDERSTQFVDNVAAPANVALLFEVTADNSGLVTLTPNAEGAMAFDIFLGDGTVEPISLEPGETIDNVYEEGTYTVKTVAKGINGLTTELDQQLVVAFIPPQNLEVSIANDGTVSNTVRVTANAEFAINYQVDFGEVDGDDDVVTANIGEEIVYEYDAAGSYDITVTAFSAAIETTQFVEEGFEVTAILAPLVSAATPPGRSAEDVISIFSDAYTDIEGTDFFPDWGQQTTFNEFDLNGDKMLQYSNLNYQGINIGASVDATTMETLHIDIWTPDATTIDVFILPNGVAPEDERFVTLELVPNQWNNFDIDLEEYTSQGLPIEDILQFKFVGSGTVFIDNLYFFRASTTQPPFDDGLLNNGNFENGSESWLVGVDDNSSAPVTTENGNTFYSVDVTSAGEPFSVNLSQKVEIIQGETYTLSFDAWSNVDRPIRAGIGLSGGNFANNSQDLDINATVTNYTLTLEATDFGATDARVLFDVGAAVGIVNIDNVSLNIVVDNLLNNGDFENGSESWLVGVDDNSSAPVTTENGNTFYSVDVTSAGEPFSVNLSQKVEIIQGETYTLTFDAWSNVDRPIRAGIGLSGGNFANNSQDIDINPTITTYTLTLEATDFGATDARVLFDVGAAVGIVNIDNVILSLD